MEVTAPQRRGCHRPANKIESAGQGGDVERAGKPAPRLYGGVAQRRGIDHHRQTHTRTRLLAGLAVRSRQLEVHVPTKKHEFARVHRCMMGSEMFCQPRPRRFRCIRKGAVCVPHRERALPDTTHEQATKHACPVHVPSFSHTSADDHLEAITMAALSAPIGGSVAPQMPARRPFEKR